jgi:CubicO group peptidase (beta-lactamase class C family)
MFENARKGGLPMKEYTRRQYEDLFAPVMEGPAGAAVAVLDGDRVLFEHFYGLANLEHQVPVTSRTVFPLSSVTKQFTAMLILLLVEGGRLEYETMLSASLPEFAAYEPDITLRQLLHHTSGLPDPYAYFAARDISTYGVTNADILKSFVGSTPLSFEPGTAFEYSNLNYIALAQLAETA